MKPSSTQVKILAAVGVLLAVVALSATEPWLQAVARALIPGPEIATAHGEVVRTEVTSSSTELLGSFGRASGYVCEIETRYVVAEREYVAVDRFDFGN